MLEFVVAGEPVAKGRPKFSARGGFVKVYTPAETLKHEEVIRCNASNAMRGLGLQPTGRPLYVKIFIFKSIPESWSGKKKALALAGEILPTGKPDSDNYAKLVCDACNGTVWIDDCQITDLYCKKRYSDTPHTKIFITELQKAAHSDPVKSILTYHGDK
jgi:Holliday junction resolvase RusA-like endonuclease